MSRYAKKSLLGALCITSLALTSIASWLLCEMNYPDGQIHVVNSLDQDLTVAVDFPSGAREVFKIKAEHQYDFKVKATGEGSIKVRVNGQELPCYSYVTSMNPLIVLTLKKHKVLFTQHFRQK